MYTTIEAEIENGQLKGSEVGKLPNHAHVLITLLTESPKKQPDWISIKSQLGKLGLRGDTVDWQRKIRSGWE